MQRRFNQDVVDRFRFDGATGRGGRHHHCAPLGQVVNGCLVVVAAGLSIELIDLLPKDIHRDSLYAHPEADLKKVPAVVS